MNISDLLGPCQGEFTPRLDPVISGSQLPDTLCVAANLPGTVSQAGNSTRNTAPRQQSTRKPSVKPKRKRSTTTESIRKHKTYLSAKQKAERDAHAAFESRVLNLTLDINDLQQLIRLLEERRDLHVTRLIVARQQFENDIYRVMERYMRVFGALTRRRTCNELTAFLSHVDPCMLGPDMNAKGSLPFFMWQWGCYNNRFHHWRFTETSTRIITFIEEGDVEYDSVTMHERSQAPGPGGCVVELIGAFTGKPTRAMVAAMFPNLLSDEGFTASLTLQTMNFPARIFVYFDVRRKIVKHVLEADAFAALQAIVEVNSSRNTGIAPNERFTELPNVSATALHSIGDKTETSSEISADGDGSSEGVSEASSAKSRYDIGYLLN
ncbi:hypothetical protein ON010_g15606 [Phytophthora cinnamomi]|nr:hypothetical protein ON010_g15606 [Phytophthora cinnamomi]